MPYSIKVHPGFSRKCRQTKTEDAPKSCNSFAWSLEPIAKCMRFLGISLPTDVYGHRSWFDQFHRVFSFLLVVSIQTSQVIHIFQNAKSVSNAYVTGISTTALSWNFIIDNFNLAFYTIGGHGFLLLLTQPKTWTNLMKPFKLLEKNLPSTDIYPDCKQFCVKAIIYITISMLLFDALIGADVMLNDSSLTRKVLEIAGYLTKIYSTIALALFCILARTVSLYLRSIRIRIRHKFIKRPLLSDVDLEFKCFLLKILRKQHRLVCSSIRKLNRYFGIFLVIEVTYIFVAVTNDFMFVLMSAISGDGLLGIVNCTLCIDQMMRLFLLASYSDKITKEVNKIYEVLTELLHHETTFQNEVFLFTEQLFRLQSSIDAMGFFRVTKKLFPSLIGTTLTYFLILLQFHTAEKQ